MSILSKLKKTKNKEKQETPKKKEETSPLTKQISRSQASLIKHVWITEKAGDLANLRKYSFIVDRKANKPEIKKAIELIYGIKVISVNVVNIKGKPRRMGRTLGRTSSYKKAIITLKEGQKIDVMPT